ncbi:hypothetical protein TCAL_04918 [Tigriopus californicus]|uniref:SHSP domain-containing protein n=1 Tax=Tigriopus californicus TaxID=6832 RepID=A0A553NE83_TIGCA|nr:heat shock protein Hsp-16.48/Hsp-16.49-like [Tigriopus californicus]TRY63741.1 hypothetical protein TCAL_04918 [Tigriopus californicus]|eukprot:TCALIF_04918-PA protein Name:"Similar to hsp-16.48 Heat shock protein Hsp-16.48/Hsp-16.49 (Caenorhabditis elegans)" AED:0.00 eAED:0.00 QI:19/1/1/1/0/0.5/2/56/183
MLRIRNCHRLIPFGARSCRRTFFGPPTKWDPLSVTGSLVRDMERNITRMEREMDRFWGGQRSGSLPSFTLVPPVQHLSQDDGKYRLQLDLHGFKPEDVKINLQERSLQIEAKLEQKDEDGSRHYQEITRCYTIPENVDIDHLKSVLKADGILSIEAPLKANEPPKDENHEIPIQRQNNTIKEE